MDLLAQRDPTCIFDPESPQIYPWGGNFASSFSTNLGTFFIPSSGTTLLFGWNNASFNFYNGLVSTIAINYWNNQTYNSTNNTYWDYIVDYCTEEFPIVNNGLFNFSPDRMACYSRAYRASLTLFPSYSDSAYTLDTIDGFGVTVQHLSSTDPFGNWGFNFFNKVNEIKQCKVWFDRKDALNCE